MPIAVPSALLCSSSIASRFCSARWLDLDALITCYLEGWQSGPIVGKGCQQRRDKVARPLFDQNLGPRLRATKPQVRLDAVDRGFFDPFHMCFESFFAASVVHIAYHHPQDFLDRNLPGRIDRLQVVFVW